MADVMRIDVYHHLDLGEEFKKLRIILMRMEKLIVTTQAELAQALTVLGQQIDKAKTEITERVAALEEALGDAGNVTPEVQAAFDALKAKVQVLDDLNPDTPTP